MLDNKQNFCGNTNPTLHSYSRMENSTPDSPTSHSTFLLKIIQEKFPDCKEIIWHTTLDKEITLPVIIIMVAVIQLLLVPQFMLGGTSVEKS